MMVLNKSIRLSAVIGLFLMVTSVSVKAEGDTLQEQSQFKNLSIEDKGKSSFRMNQLIGKYEGYYSFKNGDVAYFLLFIDDQLSTQKLRGKLIIHDAMTNVELELQNAEGKVFIEQLGEGEITLEDQKIKMVGTGSNMWKLVAVSNL